MSFSIRPQVLWLFMKKDNFTSIESTISSLDYEKLENWNKCIHGYIYNINPNVSVYDNHYYKNELDDIKSKYKNYMELLMFRLLIFIRKVFKILI